MNDNGNGGAAPVSGGVCGVGGAGGAGGGGGCGAGGGGAGAGPGGGPGGGAAAADLAGEAAGGAAGGDAVVNNQANANGTSESPAKGLNSSEDLDAKRRKCRETEEGQDEASTVGTTPKI